MAPDNKTTDDIGEALVAALGFDAEVKLDVKPKVDIDKKGVSKSAEDEVLIEENTTKDLKEGTENNADVEVTVQKLDEKDDLAKEEKAETTDSSRNALSQDTKKLVSSGTKKNRTKKKSKKSRTRSTNSVNKVDSQEKSQKDSKITVEASEATKSTEDITLDSSDTQKKRPIKSSRPKANTSKSIDTSSEFEEKLNNIVTPAPLKEKIATTVPAAKQPVAKKSKAKVAKFEPPKTKPQSKTNNNVEKLKAIVGTDSGIETRLKARKVRRVVRHIDPWSVLTFSAIFNIVVFSSLFIAGLIIFIVASWFNMLENFEGIIQQVGEYQSFEIKLWPLAQAMFIFSGIMIILSTMLLVMLAVIFNLISDLVGGIRLTVVEEDLVSVNSSENE